jgi:hypothetical protein
MPKYHAVMIDETGCEFGVDVETADREHAYAALRNGYSESRCVQLESQEDTAKREAAIYDHINRGGDWDDDGRPIFHYGDDNGYDEMHDNDCDCDDCIAAQEEE